MKQVVQDIRSGKIQVLEVPIPVTQPGTVLVRTAASLVSAGTERMLLEFGSKSMLGKARSRPDLVQQTLDKAKREGVLNTIDAVRNRLDQPLPMGYSSAGEVIEVGDGVGSLRAGDRVACAGAGAAHAEYVVVTEMLATPLPQAVDFESGAFTTLGAIALHGFRLGEAQLGSNVAVIGLGLLGQLAASLAKSAGCRVLGIDLESARVTLARGGGIESVLRQDAPSASETFTQGMGFDLVLICAASTSNDPIQLAGEIARDRAAVVAVGAVGMDVPRRDFYNKELRVLVSRSYGPGRYDPSYEELGFDYPPGYVRWTECRNFEAFLSLLSEGSIDVGRLITHRIPISEAKNAYEAIQDQGGKQALAIVLTYPEAEGSTPERIVRFPGKRSRGDIVPLVKLGALGAGNFAAAVLYPILSKLEGIELIGVASANGLRAADAAKKFGFRYATTEEDQIVQDGEINAVAILTRHHLHADQSSRTLEAGKHVFSEKPLAMNQEELDRVFQSLRSSEGVLTVGFNRRFAPLAVKLKEFFSTTSSPLLVHYRVNAGALPSDHWLHDPAQGGGRLIGEACHFVDFLVFLTGALPIDVFTRGLPDVEPFREDNVSISIQFSNGSVGTIDYLACGDPSVSKECVEVFGGGRAAKLYNFRRLELSSEGKTRTIKSNLRQDKGHQGIWQAFVHSLRSGDAPPIPYEQIYAVHRATFAALVSLRIGEKQAVVLPGSEGVEIREG